ncbi:hypothetical protein EVAR_92353_1 [Eumeta japonica]|uniref:Uncharacterized protein n=1 Tax=Eumeta variegata TaxID=151549 RepID=A0A4C1TII5_EUMVA|nr:hypothetical protein EVAR_92353_1 [Eumeta japonica]
MRILSGKTGLRVNSELHVACCMLQTQLLGSKPSKRAKPGAAASIEMERQAERAPLAARPTRGARALAARFNPSLVLLADRGEVVWVIIPHGTCLPLIGERAALKVS